MTRRAMCRRGIMAMMILFNTTCKPENSQDDSNIIWSNWNASTNYQCNAWSCAALQMYIGICWTVKTDEFFRIQLEWIFYLRWLGIIQTDIELNAEHQITAPHHNNPQSQRSALPWLTVNQANVLRKMPQSVMEKIEKLQLECKVQRLLYQLKMPQNVMKSGHSFS